MPHARLTVSVLLAGSLAACGPNGSTSLVEKRLEVIQACARMAACRPSVTAVVNATACAALDARSIEHMSRSSMDQMRCVNRAGGDCGAVFTCLDPLAGLAPCDPAVTPASCREPTVVSSCLAGLAIIDDCQDDELTCVSVPDGGTGCGVEACAPDLVASCADDAQQVTCVGGIAVRQPCPEGSRCRDGKCVGAGAPCSPGTAPFCADGTALVVCQEAGQARQDCAYGGFQRRCESPDGGVAGCTGAERECSSATFRDRCNGVRLEYCEDGRVRGLDCVELGFAGCTPGGDLPSTCQAIIADGGLPPTIDAPPAIPDAAAVTD